MSTFIKLFIVIGIYTIIIIAISERYHMRKESKLARESIMLCIASIKEDIESTSDEESNKTRADTIKILAESMKVLK